MIEATYYDLKQMTGPPPSLSTLVASEIGKRIVSSHYHPGGLVEDEGALATRYGVSRSVIRDAVKILVGKGLLEVRRGVGTRVRDRSHWGLLDDDVMAWSQAGPVSAESLRQLLDVRKIFEPKAARWAAERGSDEALDEIRLAIESMEACAGEGDDFILSDALFHRAILRATNNEFLVALEGIIFSSLLSSIRLTNMGAIDIVTSIPLHRDVYEAISKRDGFAAEQTMERLLSDTDDRLNERLNDPDHMNL